MSIAGLAAKRATSEQMTVMAEEIGGMFATLDEPEQFLIHDLNFHQTMLILCLRELNRPSRR